MKKKYNFKLLAFFICSSLLLSCNQDKEKEKDTYKPNLKDPLAYKSPLDKNSANYKKGIEFLAEYQNDIRKPIDAEEGSYEKGYLMTELVKAKKNKQTNRNYNSRLVDATFEERGPANVPGRARGIIAAPNNPDKLYTGTAGGGVWTSEDGGNTWESLTDYKIPNLSTSTIALSTNEPETLYVGTGEPFGNLDAIGGVGLFKSTDAGTSWTYLQSTQDFGDIGRIEVNPTDANHVVVGSATGVYLSTDGGSTWQQTYSNRNIQDLDADPSNFNTLYACANSFGVIKSTDGGLTWSNALNRFNYNINHERFELDIFPSNTNRIVVGVYTPNGRASVAVNTDFYISEDAGSSFTRLGYEGNNDEANLISGQGWYNNIVLAHPFDENVFYVGGIALFKVNITPTDNFTFASIASGYDQGLNDYVHVDQHGLFSITRENNEFKILLANDGGIYYTDYKTDPGSLFDDWSQAAFGLNSTQFYGADKINGADDYIAGAQDNGTWVSQSGNTSAISLYNSVQGGDGFETLWHYQDQSKYLATTQFNYIGRYDNGAFTYVGFPDSNNNSLSPFISKLANANNNPETVFAVSTRGVWRSTEFGFNWELTPISNFNPGNVSAIDVAVSIANPEIIWTGGAMTESGSFSLYISQDNGLTFTTTETFQDPRAGVNHDYFVSGLYTSPTSEERAYALFSSQGAAKILKTENSGQSWTDLSGFSQNQDRGFPDVAVHSAVEMPFDEQVIWVGTDIGIFETENGGGSWTLKEDFPNVSVWDMKIVNDQIVIATHGRGIWTATLSELEGYEPPAYFGSPLARIENTYQNNLNSTSGTIAYTVGSDLITKVHVVVDGAEVELVENSFQPGQTYTYSIPDLDEGIYEISLQGEAEDGRTSAMDMGELVIINYNEPQSLVQIETFQNSDVFNYLGEFEINDLDGSISQEALNNSDHPYLDNAVYRTTLRTPIIITENYPTFFYEDVALVEPGDAGGIYDYVVIEGSTDLQNWDQLDIYDATRFNEWVAEYNTGINAEITDDLFREQSIPLLQTYSEGQTVVLRFSLITDPFVTSYGWAIRSINKDVQLSIEDDILTANDIIIYPTITQSSIKLVSKLPKKGITVEIYSMSGQQIKNENLDLYSNAYDIPLTNLSTGMYFVRVLQNGSILKTQKIIKK